MNYEQLIEAKIKPIELNGAFAIGVGLIFVLSGIALFAFSVFMNFNTMERRLTIVLSAIIWFYGLVIGASGSYKIGYSRLIAESSITAINSSK